MINADYRDDDILLSRDAEELPESSRARTSWLVALLFLPVAFLAGWIGNEYVNGRQYQSATSGVQYGVGAGPAVFPSESPQTTPIVSPIDESIRE